MDQFETERNPTMTSSKRNFAFTAAGVVAVLALGAGAGAGLYASVAPTSTTTVVRDVGSAGALQNASDTSGAISVPAVYQRAHRGVVDITVTQSSGTSQFFGGSQTTRAEGSGWVYDSKGDIVTNEHVAGGASSITITLWNGRSFKGHLVGTDSSTDLAVVRISAPASMLTPLALGNSDAVQVGSPVVAIGSPFGLSETVTSGIVSALGRSIDAPNNFTIPNAIQTDAPINHGNSGGPLLDARGRVIGINAQIRSDSGNAEGVGFAIPINSARRSMEQLISTGKVTYAYVGVTTQDVTPAVARRFDLGAQRGALIQSVVDGAPAAAAGLHGGSDVEPFNGISINLGGDLIVSFAGQPVERAADIAAIVTNRLRPGQTVSVTVVRGGDGKRETVRLRLIERPLNPKS
jgi:S1-C subfamily serine protease